MLTVTRTTLLTYSVPSSLSSGFPVPLPAATRRALQPATRAPARAVAPPAHTATAARALLPFIPRPLKLVLLALLLSHYRSLPGFWHLRVFRPVLALRLRALAFFSYVRLCILAARAARALRLPGVPPASGPGILALGLPGARQQFMHQLAARAINAPDGPLDASVKTLTTTWASLDDCDWNWHLSNSAYNKNSDYARTDFLFAYLAPYFADGGYVALGQSDFHFVREIGIGQSYTIETRIATWDGKWLYLVGRFLSRKTPAQRRKEKGKGKALPGGTDTPPSSSTPRTVPFAVWPPKTLFPTPTPTHSKETTATATMAKKSKEDKGQELVDMTASFTTAADDLEGDVDSILSPDEAAARSSSTSSPVRERTEIVEDDGEWTLHAVGIASYCFKHRGSRRSVPPALVLAGCGFGDGMGESPSPWDRLQRMRHGGAAGDARRFWAGAWAAPDAEQFWEPVARRWEEGRVRGMEELRRQ
ncbi:hypothetical protein AURDEDRAFT_182971 [Auricularia subglabra TFB-10046 SS5]|nr:hypothetical protein AURDEDRAFT_182971 [Auricularia subglabra TFB-10046 SS5]